MFKLAITAVIIAASIFSGQSSAEVDISIEYDSPDGSFYISSDHNRQYGNYYYNYQNRYGDHRRGHRHDSYYEQGYRRFQDNRYYEPDNYGYYWVRRPVFCYDGTVCGERWVKVYR